MLNKKKEWILAVVILLATFLFFSPVLKNDFVNWDDDINVTENKNVTELNAQSITQMFTHTVVGSYTPLTTLTFAVENHFSGMKPWVYHLNNLLLHLLCTLLVFIFLRQLGASLFITFVTVLLFGIHPMRVESVAWVSERKDVLYGLFYLLSLVSYITFHKSRKLVFYFLALLAFVFALLSKIQAVTLPLILILIDYFFEGKFRPKQVLNKIPFFILSLLTGIAGVYLLGKQGTLETNAVMPFFQRFFVGTYTLCVYLYKSYCPTDLSAIYPTPEKLTWLFYGSPLLVALLAVIVYRLARDIKEIVFGSLFFFFNVMFMLQIVGAGTAFLADRFTYLAYIGLFFIMAWALEFLYNSRWKVSLIVAGVLYISVLGYSTWNRSQVWKNSETLFTDVIKKYPNSSMANNNLGIYYRNQNQNTKAIEAYTRAISVNPNGFLGFSNRGELYFQLGQVDKALSDINAALRLKPDYSLGLSNRGVIWGSLKKFDQALADLDKAISIDPDNLKAYSNRSLAHYSLGNFEKASQDATIFLKTNPDDANILNHRGLCYDQMNRDQEAVTDFNRAIQLKPNNGIYIQNRSYVLAKMGDFNGALKDILKARDLGIKVNQAYVDMLQTR